MLCIIDSLVIIGPGRIQKRIADPDAVQRNGIIPRGGDEQPGALNVALFQNNLLSKMRGRIIQVVQAVNGPRRLCIGNPGGQAQFIGKAGMGEQGLYKAGHQQKTGAKKGGGFDHFGSIL